MQDPRVSNTGRMQAALLEEPAALDPLLHVVLLEPQIPANTGNVARTCAALGMSLHLVGTLGFDMSDKALRRAGLDYWPSVDLHWHPGLVSLEALLGPRAWYLFTARAQLGLYDAPVKRGDVLLFGREDLGLPEALLAEKPESCVRVPMRACVRSLNLSTCVGIAAFEALRRIGTAGL